MRQVTRKGLMTVAAATGVIAAVSGQAHADSGASGSSSKSPGVLSGNTVQAPVDVPVNVCGNSVNVVGILNPALGNECVNQGGNSGHGGSGGSGGSQADGHAKDSPGVGSGNHVQAPVHVPVNVCGNSVDIIGVGSGTKGNDCANNDGSGGGQPSTPPGGGDHETPPPGNPDDPGNPEQPGDPGDPGEPGDPGNPEQPGNPGNPGDPGNPEQPGNPVEPGTPPGADDETPDGGNGSSQGNQTGAQSISQPQGSAQLAHTGGDLPLGVVLPVGAGALLAGTVLYRRARASA
ncbi:chaplin [Streptomyces blattellae]|uniref:chaplin n=1 Tax=Streptomyces blattellae TaxID=2569855 RepID=UPI0012B788F1|nr:chaplin family protein [Streptomyces blattellae]